jgi:hypothetical protein
VDLLDLPKTRLRRGREADLLNQLRQNTGQQ